MIVFGKSRVRSYFRRYIELMADEEQSFEFLQDRVRVAEYDLEETGKRGVWEIIPKLNVSSTSSLIYAVPSDEAFLWGELSFPTLRGSRDPNSRDNSRYYSYKFRPTKAGAKEEDIRKMIGDYGLDIFFVERS